MCVCWRNRCPSGGLSDLVHVWKGPQVFAKPCIFVYCVKLEIGRLLVRPSLDEFILYFLCKRHTRKWILKREIFYHDARKDFSAVCASSSLARECCCCCCMPPTNHPITTADRQLHIDLAMNTKFDRLWCLSQPTKLFSFRFASYHMASGVQEPN